MRKRGKDFALYGPNGERYCPRCGAQVGPEEEVCLACGTRLFEPTRSRRIPIPEIVFVLMVAILVSGWWQVRGSRQAAVEATWTAVAQYRASVTPTHTATWTPTVTPSATPTRTPTPTPSPTPHIYVVQLRDTLSSIATQFGITVELLRKANHLQPDDYIVVGQKLIIPPPDGHLEPTPTPTPRSGIINYTVQEEDTLLLIAERFNVSQESIVQANHLDNPALLKPGMVLVIPLSTPVPTPTPTPYHTPTPTPGPPYPVPILVLPPDGATFDLNQRVLLAWTAVGYLWPSEEYEVRLMAGGRTWYRHTRQPFLELPPELKEELGRAGGTVRWSVRVVDVYRQVALSPRSEERTFILRSPSP